MGQFSAKCFSRKRQFHSLTGVRQEQFQDMVLRLESQWQRRVVAPRKKDGRPWGIGGLEDHLLVLLILYRCHITQDFMACLYGVDKSAICRSLQRIEPIARRVLGARKKIRVTPEEARALIADCTEQPVRRPKRKQRCYYSGKKKRHTIKTEIIITQKGRIVAVSDSAPGTVHDITLRKRGPPIPEEAILYVDSGYQGYQKDHPNLEYPYKSSKKHPLTEDERDYNHALSSFRVRVEHVIARIKRYNILSDKYRYPRAKYNTKFAIIAGITNLTAGF